MCGGGYRTITYDANGRWNVLTDFRNTRFDYDFNTAGLLDRRVDAVDSAESRLTQTDWHPDFRQPTERRTYNAANILESRETWTYNARGQVLTRSDIDPTTSATRTWTYSYCEQADVDAPGSTCPILGYRKAIDGPRTDAADLTTFAYHPATDESGCGGDGPCHRRGDLWTVTNALGHVTEHRSKSVV